MTCLRADSFLFAGLASGQNAADEVVSAVHTPGKDAHCARGGRHGAESLSGACVCVMLLANACVCL